MLDAIDFLTFADRLHALRQRLESSELTREERTRLHRRLIRITDGAVSDLTQADHNLARLEDEVARQLEL